jgi:hypothetical protein
MRKIFVLVCTVVVMFIVGCAKSTPAGPTPPTGSFVVSLSPESPAPADVLEGQLGVEFLEFVLTNSTNSSVTVAGISVGVEGPGASSSLTKLYLFNNDINIAEITADFYGIADFYNESGIIIVPSGQSVPIKVKADIANGTSGQTIFLSFKGIVASFQPTVEFPLSSSVMTIQ